MPRSTKRSTASVVCLGRRTKTSGCHVHGQLPDSATVSQICTPGYSESVRSVPESVKEGAYAEYGIESHAPGRYEVDHLISLELGGSNSIANLWPEIRPGYHAKDGIENRLHRAVCSHTVSLRAAQREIAHDWRHTFVGAPSGTTERVTPRPPTTTSPTGTPKSNPTVPLGATARCEDGTYSFSQSRSGTCSHHGGVAEWL